MALTQAVTSQTVIGNKRLVWGTFNCASVTGGAILTGLANCEMFNISEGGTSVLANTAVINETLPKAGGSITIVTDTNATGYWFAIGV